MKKALCVFAIYPLLGILLAACSLGPRETVIVPSPTSAEPTPAHTRLPTPTSPPRAKITVDGQPFDWKAGDILFVDSEGDSRHDGFDIATVFALANDEHLYLMVETWWPRKDYQQLDLEIEAAERRFLVSFRPEEGGPATMAEFINGEWVDMDMVADSLVAAKRAVELQLPLAAIGGASRLQLTNVRPMGDEHCGDDCTAVDETEPVQVEPVD